MTITQGEFYALCSSPSGILLENSFVRIGIRQEYTASQGRIFIYIGNVCRCYRHASYVTTSQQHNDINNNESTLKNVTVSINDQHVHRLRLVPDWTLTTNGLLSANGCNIVPSNQVKLVLLVRTIGNRPFDNSPTIRIMFYSNGGRNHHEHHVLLPIIATSFLQKPTSSLVDNLQQFQIQWKRLEQMECRTILTNIPKIVNYTTYVNKIIHVLTHNLHFVQCPLCDDTLWSVTVAASYPTTTNDNNNVYTCLVRIEVDRNHRAVRVSTRTTQLQGTKVIHGIVLGNIQNM